MKIRICTAIGAMALSAWATTDVGLHPFHTIRPRIGSVGARSLDASPQVYQTQHFAIFYTTTGAHAVAQAGLGVDGSGVPRVIDSMGQLAEQVWRVAIDTLGYPVPGGIDSVLGFGVKNTTGKFPVEVMDLATADPSFQGQALVGFATNPSQDASSKKGMELLVENDFLDGGTTPIRVIVDPVNNNGDSVLYDYSKDPLKGWAVALAHEFYHNLQYEYDYGFTYAFHEMTATWFPMRVFPNIHHEWGYFKGFMSNLRWSAFSTNGSDPYYNYVLISELAHVYGDNVLKQLWPLHATDFTGSEEIWYHKSLIKLGKNELDVNEDYLRGVLATLVNGSHFLNQFGKLQASVTLPQNGPIADSTSNTSFGGGDFYAINMEKLDRNQFSNGWNMMFVDGIDSTMSVGGWAELPSKRVFVVHPGKGRFVFTRDAGDTSVYAGMLNVVANTSEIGCQLYGTKAPASGVQSRVQTAEQGAPKLRLDLYGRPVGASKTGIVFEGDNIHGWKRRVILGE
jgi:hypothetical protein